MMTAMRMPNNPRHCGFFVHITPFLIPVTSQESLIGFMSHIFMVGPCEKRPHQSKPIASITSDLVVVAGNLFTYASGVTEEVIFSKQYQCRQHLPRETKELKDRVNDRETNRDALHRNYSQLKNTNACLKLSTAWWKAHAVWVRSV